MTPPEPTFLFATCNPGREAALKREVGRRFGDAVVPAFLRPGLVTWKSHREIADRELSPPPVYARIFGRSFGMAADPGALAALLEQAPPLPLWIFPRVFPENGYDEAQWRAFDEVRASLLAALPGKEEPQSAIAPGDPVLDLIVGDPGEPVFAGIHRQEAGYPSHPGSIPRLVLREGVPSRAWLKMEQALAFLGLEDLSGWQVLELGCAPGGASLAMLERGARVIGVDTGAMDPAVLSHPGFHSLGISAGEVDVAQLPRQVDLLVSDMNLAPPVALRYIERLQRRLRARVLILTLKINDAKMETAIPAFLERVSKLLPRHHCLATQLPANRQEITILARDPRGRLDPLGSRT